MDNFWFNFQGAEATKHGALAVILTSNYSDGTDMDYPSAPWYVVQPDALGANDGEYDMGFVPLIYMSQQDGDWLKAEIDGGFTEATFVSDVDITHGRGRRHRLQRRRDAARQAEERPDGHPGTRTTTRTSAPASTTPAPSSPRSPPPRR